MERFNLLNNYTRLNRPRKNGNSNNNNNNNNNRSSQSTYGQLKRSLKRCRNNNLRK